MTAEQSIRSYKRSEVNKKEYSEHAVFEDLKIYIDFYDQFSTSIMSFPTNGHESNYQY
jgi:hypothetical protein